MKIVVAIIGLLSVATIGSIGPSGQYIVGDVSGTINIITSQNSTLADTSPITVTPTNTGACLNVVGGVYPNEPAGYSRVFEHNYQAIPNGNNGVAGTDWWEQYGASDLSIVSEGAATCLRTRWPQGMGAGGSPVLVSVDQIDNGTRRTKQYFSLWFKIEGTDFENQAVGTKFSYFGYGEDAGGALNQGFLIFRNKTGVKSLESSLDLELWQQGSIADRTIGRNVGVGYPVTVGDWHHLEFVMIDNSVGSSNGQFHMWIDNEKTHQYTNVVYRNSSLSMGFRGWKWEPVWGGIGGSKSRSDYVRFAHVYLSGN